MSAGYAPEDDPPLDDGEFTPTPPPDFSAPIGSADTGVDQAYATGQALADRGAQGVPDFSQPEPSLLGQPDQPIPAAGADTVMPLTPEAPPAPDVPAQMQPLGPIPPPPQPPKLSGNPQQDVQANLQFQRDLGAYQGELSKRQALIDQHTKAVEAKRAGAELAAEQHAQEARKKLEDEYNARRAERQNAIDLAVAERAKAYGDLTRVPEGHKLRDAVMIALGAYSQGLMNAAMIQSGHAPTAQNEGLNTVNKLMAAETDRRKQRLAAASDGLLEARYGYKDAAENRRAALNDLDAETAAKYKLIAKEAESQLRAQGADAATIAANKVILDARAKAAQLETGIHQREESIDVGRQNAAANQQIARSHLGLAQAQLAATLAEKGEQRKEKADKTDAETTIFDPRTGNKKGNAPTKERALVATKELQLLNDVRGDIDALKTHVKQEGAVAPRIPLVGNVTEASQTRESLAKNLVTRLASFKQLGAISKDDRVIVEGMINGGAAGILGTNAKQLDKLLEAVDRAEQNALKAQGIKSAEPAASKPAVMKLGSIEYRLQPDGTYK